MTCEGDTVPPNLHMLYAYDIKSKSIEVGRCPVRVCPLSECPVGRAAAM